MPVITTRRTLATGALGTLGWALARRPWMRTGADEEEVTARLPGDELLPYATVQATRAITLDAPPPQVWPWLEQMGTGRAGWYGFDAVDNGGRPSLEHLDPSLGTLEEGQRISDATGPFSFEVAAVDAPRSLVLRAAIHPVTGRPVPAGRRDTDAWRWSEAFLDFTWAFVLVPDGDGTRLLVRVRYLHSRGAWVRAMVEGYELVDALFSLRMLRGLRARVEGPAVTAAPAPQAAPPEAAPDLACPLTVRLDTIAAFVNAEFVDDPTYDGLEIQRYDDAGHGQGLAVLLSRRADRRVDVLIEEGVEIERELLAIGAGLGEWRTVPFERAVLEVHPDGVTVDVAVTDGAGQRVEVTLDDRDGRLRRRGTLLAPVGAAISDPQSLLLVRIGRFELVHDGPRPPLVRIGGREATTGSLPAGRLHGRRLIKYGTDLAVVRVNPTGDAVLDQRDARDGVPEVTGGGIAAVVAADAAHRARLQLTPPLPAWAGDPAIGDGAASCTGRWSVTVDDDPPLTGGTWTVDRQRDEEVAIRLDVTDRWRPRGLPWLMRIVTTVIPTFRRWPTSYTWRGTVQAGPPAKLQARWSRTVRNDELYASVTQRRARGSG